jgi:HrpA-like RNA helicase
VKPVHPCSSPSISVTGAFVLVLTDSGRDSLLVKGRMYNVSTRHVVDPVDDFIEAAANKVMAIHCAIPAVQGDVLVFMPGESHSPQLKRSLSRKLMNRFGRDRNMCRTTQESFKRSPTRFSSSMSPSSQHSNLINSSKSSRFTPGYRHQPKIKSSPPSHPQHAE